MEKNLYVIRKDFEKSPKLFIKIDRNEYEVDMGESNSYGLLKKSPRKNRKLHRDLKKN